MHKFRLEKTLQKLSSVHSAFHNYFNFERHMTKGDNFKAQRDIALAEWRKFCEA
jgi:putative transposase